MMTEPEERLLKARLAECQWHFEQAQAILHNMNVDEFDEMFKTMFEFLTEVWRSR